MRAGITPDLLHDIFDRPGAYIEVVRKNYSVAGYEMSVSHDYGDEYDESELLEDSPQKVGLAQDQFQPTNTMFFRRSWPARSVRFPETMALTFDAMTDYEHLVGVMFEWNGRNSQSLWESFSMPDKGNWQLTRITKPGVLFPGPETVAQKPVLSTSPEDLVLAAMATTDDYIWEDPGIHRLRTAIEEPASQFLDLEFIKKEGLVAGWAASLALVSGNLLTAEYRNGILTNLRGSLVSKLDVPAYYYQGTAYLVSSTFDPGSILQSLGKLKA